jgi:hypothetical protein
MNYISVIKIKLNELVFGRSKSKKDVTPYDCAEIVGKSYNYLWKICSMSEDHPFPMEYLVPLMKAKNNFDVLEQMARECGFVVVKLPKGKMARGEENEMVHEMQIAANKVVAAFMDFIKSGREEHSIQVIDLIMKDIQTKLSVKKYVEKRASRQEDLF